MAVSVISTPGRSGWYDFSAGRELGGNGRLGNRFALAHVEDDYASVLMSALKMGLAVLLSLSGVAALAAGVVSAEGIRTPAPTLRAPVSANVRPHPPVFASAKKEEKPVEAAPAEPVAVKAPEAKPAEVPKPAPTPAEPVKAPAAEAPKPQPKEPPAKPAPAPAAPASAAEGRLTMRASDTADVYLDGKKVGQSPVSGYRAKAGAHKVRFDCYDSSGNAQKGDVQTVLVPPDEDVEVEFQCLVE
jgi:outer membrane biosynthesis protein TonB